jgi:predicted MFS family arabinose efflux permease
LQGDWRRAGVVAAIMLAAFSFNTAENLPIGLLDLMADDLEESMARTGLLVSGYGLVVAAASLPLAYLTRGVPRRYVLTGVLAALALGTALAAATDSFGLLLGARIITAAAQALFWAVMGPVAVGLFSENVRGRVIGLVSVGGALATVAGVPAGNWIAHRTAWEIPFLIVSVLAVVSLVAIGMLLPTSDPETSHAAYGEQPDRRRCLALLATTAISVAGVFTAFTYIVEFLPVVSGFAGDAVSALLGVFGLAGLLGVTLIGPLLDRFPRGTLAVPVLVQTAALLVLYAAGSNPAVTVAAVAFLGGSAAPIFMATQNLVLRVAPGRTEIALASNSAAFNVGIAAGAWLGGVALEVFDVRTTFLVGGLLSACALPALATVIIPSRSRGMRSVGSRGANRYLAGAGGRTRDGDEGLG